MTFNGLIGDISEALKNCVSDGIKFSVDLPTMGDGDLFSNVTKICGNMELPEELPFTESFSVDGGFLNIRLREDVFLEFISSVEIEREAKRTEINNRFDAYIQLAENERNLAGAERIPMVLTADVRRIILCLMKAQSFFEADKSKAQLSINEAIRILDKIRSSCENLKEFVITYEPLLISVRGSLSKIG